MWFLYALDIDRVGRKGLVYTHAWKTSSSGESMFLSSNVREERVLHMLIYHGRLGIELAKTMSLNYSNQETSVTVGESVRDEDGILPLLSLAIHIPNTSSSIHPPIHRSRRHQRRPHGTPNNDQRLPHRLSTTHHRRNPQLPIRPTRQERQISCTDLREIDSEYVTDSGM